jgi:Holliday junction resolvase RusA-like endonuclease
VKRDTVPCGPPESPLSRTFGSAGPWTLRLETRHELAPRTTAAQGLGRCDGAMLNQEPGLLDFWVPGEPVPKARARTVTTPSGKRGTFTPDTTAAYERLVKVHALRARALARWPRPTKRDRFALEIEFRLGSERRKDLDNMVKAVGDSLQPEIVLDDWQLCRLAVTRVMRCAKPGVRVRLWRAEEVSE